MPENAPARSVVDSAPVPHCLACVRTLQASEPLESSRRMPEIAVGPRNAMLLHVAGARMTAAPLLGVKPPNSGGDDPQAASAMKKIAGTRLIIGPPDLDECSRPFTPANFSDLRRHHEHNRLIPNVTCGVLRRR